MSQASFSFVGNGSRTLFPDWILGPQANLVHVAKPGISNYQLGAAGRDASCTVPRMVAKSTNPPTSWNVECVRLPPISQRQTASSSPPAAASQQSQPASQRCPRTSKLQASRHRCLPSRLWGAPHQMPRGATGRHRVPQAGKPCGTQLIKGAFHFESGSL